MPFTADQEKVITSRGKNLLVAAAAGSGKTTVLVERVMGLVSEGANIDEMLIVTFTRAAANDMKNKFRERMSLAASGGSPRFREQLERLENASISTIHSFCADVLKSNFEQAGIDPMFRIIDDTENRQLTEKCMDEALEEAYKNEDDEAMEALDFARGPQKVRALALEMHAFLSERPDPEEWFQNALSLMEGDGSIWKDALVGAARAKIEEALALNEYALRFCSLPGGPANYESGLLSDGEAIEEMLHMDYKTLHGALSAFKQTRPGTLSKAQKAEADEALKEEMQAVRDRVKTTLQSAAKHLSLDADDSMEDIRDNKNCVIRLYEIAMSLEKRLQEKKKERCALTFGDLERYALRALRDERVAERVKSRYKFIFVDEYQDTSDVQEAIVNLISGEDNRFMVGDVKQSIYRFRQAEPGLFLQKYESYKQGGKNELIVLKQNFRSRSCVIDFTNHVFSRVMHGKDSEIIYDDDAKLYRGRDFDGEDKPVEIHIIGKDNAGEESDKNDDSADLSDAEREGLIIARRIREMRAEDPSLKYRDFCVLTRVRVNSLTHLASALSAEGIPAYADASESYFDALEVMELMSVLRLIVNRRRDVDLISVLRSPIVGLTSTELAKIRIMNKGNSFFDAVLASRQFFPKVDRLLSDLEKWRVLSRSMPVSRLIRHIADETGFYTYVGALPGGTQRQANIDALTSKAANYENIIGGSLAGFIEYAAEMQAKGDGEGAHVLSENDDVVRLMSAHKSKGLEFPVVFASMLGRKFRVSRAEDTLTAHRDMGVSLMRVDDSLQTIRDTIARRAIVADNMKRDRAEELRILYVTFTRAKSRLILTGTVRNLPSRLTEWKIAKNRPDIYTSAMDIVGAAMMEMSGAEEYGAVPKEGAPRINVYSYSENSFALSSAADETRTERALKILENAEAGECFDQTLDSAIRWQYPHKANIQAPVKLTASGLTREITGAFEIPEISERPKFLSDTSLTAAERGTAIHAFLRAIDYAPIRNLTGDSLKIALGEQKRRMLEKGILTPVQGQAVVLGAIAKFLASPIGVRLMHSEKIQREWRFNLKLPASEAIPGAPATSSVVVQGSIDLCFEENGGWVLLDYKTDRTNDKEALKARYEPQLTLYKRALSDITKMPVHETAICLIAQGDYIRLA